MIMWVRRNHTTLMVLVGAFLVIASMFTSCDANAQTTIEFKLMPPGSTGQVAKVGRVQYYLLDDYLKLAAFDAELVRLRLDVKDQALIIEKLELQVKDKDAIIATLEKDKDILSKRALRLDGELDECEKKVIDLAGGPIWPYVVGAVGAALGIAGGVAWLTSQ